MKSFLETYGIAIFTLVVIAILIAFAGPFGLRIKQYMLDKANYTHQIGTEEIDKVTNGDTQKKIDPTDIYAMLYADGELVLSPRPITPEKEVYGNGVGDYGKVENQEAVPWNPSPWDNEPTSIQKVRILDTIAPTSCYQWFSHCINLTELICFDKLNTSNVTSIYSMFQYCSSLTKYDGLQNWNVENCTNFMQTFQKCPIINVDFLSKWNTTNTTSIWGMFSSCESLVNIDGLQNWNVSKCTDFGNMFISSKLTNIDALKNWNVSNGTSFNSMFLYCSSLVNVDGLQKWDMSNATNLFQMFTNCTSLLSVNALQNWDVSKTTSFVNMFQGCTALTDASPLVSWITNGIGMKSDANTDNMFQRAGCLDPFHSYYACLYSDGELVISSKPITSNKTVKQDYGFTDDHPWSSNNSVLNVRFEGHVRPQTCAKWFNGCQKLKSIDFTNFDTSNVKNMGNMFTSCRELTTLDLSTFDTRNVTSMYQMFNTCVALKSIKLGSNFDVSKVTNIAGMFSWCNAHPSITGASDATKTKLNVTTTEAPTYISAWN